MTTRWPEIRAPRLMRGLIASLLVWMTAALAPLSAAADEPLPPPSGIELPADAVAIPAPPVAAWPEMDQEGLVSIKTPHLEIWSVPEAAGTMERLSTEVESDLMRIRRYLGAPEDNPPVRVVVLKELNAYFARRGTPPRAPAWAVGLALNEESTVLLLHGLGPRNQPVDLKATLVHELAHIALERTLGESLGHAHGADRVDVTQEGLPRQRKVPRWLHEGFAIWAAGEWTLERSTTLIEGGVSGTIMPLTRLRNGFPPSGFAVELAYAESYHFLQHLQSQYGEQTFRDMIARMRKGEDFDSAFEAAYGERFANVESSWRRGLKMTYAWVPTVFGSTAFLGAGGLLLVLAWRRRRRSFQSRLDAMSDGDDDQLPPLPGFGLSEQDVRARPWRVMRDGSVVPRYEATGYDGPIQVVYRDAEEDDAILDEEIIIGEDGIPRTSDGFTIH